MFFKFTSNTMNAAELDRMVEQFKRNAETPVQGPPESFDDRLREALKRRSGAHGRIQASVTRAPMAESFGEKLKREVQKRQAREQAQERWRKTREKLQPRPHTKSE